MRSVVLLAVLGVIASQSMIAQERIDFSGAREFKVIWTVNREGDMFPPTYVPDVCGVEGFDVFVGATITNGRFTWRTTPRLDTTNIDRSLGVYPLPYDADGIPPLEYVNTRGHILRCSNGQPTPLPVQAIDTVAGCSGTPVRSEDVDGDGYLDVLCDVGGGGYTARVIRGGPNAGKGCERVMTIPQPRSGSVSYVITMWFWKSASGPCRLYQYEADTNVWPWRYQHQLYELRIDRTNDGWTYDFVLTDSLPDRTVGDVGVMVDTAARRDWLYMECRRHVDTSSNVIERFDATEGRFTPTGEQIFANGLDFFQPWFLGHSLGTSQPVVAFQASGVGRVFCYATDLAHPFAIWNSQGAKIWPLAGVTVITDQTGDGIPDFVAAGGTNNGTVVLYTLDSAFVTHAPSDPQHETLVCRMEESMLILALPSAEEITIEIISVDGRIVDTISSLPGTAGTNHIDLSPVLDRLARGFYFVRARTVSLVQTLRLLR
jgi:hypothetical protein